MHLPGRRLTRQAALFGGLHAMVHRVAQQVHQRVGHRLDDVLVGLGLVAADVQLHLLAEATGQVAHHPGETLQHLGDGHHAHLHDGALQFLHDAVQHGMAVLDLADQLGAAGNAGGALGQVGQPVLGHHQFADEVHQVVDLFLLHAHQRRGGLGLEYRLGGRLVTQGRRRLGLGVHGRGHSHSRGGLPRNCALALQEPALQQLLDGAEVALGVGLVTHGGPLGGALSVVQHRQRAGQHMAQRRQPRVGHGACRLAAGGPHHRQTGRLGLDQAPESGLAHLGGRVWHRRQRLHGVHGVAHLFGHKSQHLGHGLHGCRTHKMQAQLAVVRVERGGGPGGLGKLDL